MEPQNFKESRQELKSGLGCVDAFRARGRHRDEPTLPNLLADIDEIVAGQSQTDTQFKSKRLFTRLLAAQVRHQLITQKGYSGEELPTSTTIGSKLNSLGYQQGRIQKSKPKKDSPD